MADKKSSEVIIVNEATMKNKIFRIRGQQVMIDSDLAEIYGYTTKAFNQQVKNNIVKFPADFRFQLTRDEVSQISRSKFLTSMQTTGIKGGRAYLPYAFTEQGVYMLMTILKGELATNQSLALIRLFKSMKDYLAENHQLMSNQSILALINRVDEHSQKISEIEKTMVTKNALANVMQLFDERLVEDEILILDGQPFKADEAYQKIYRSAKRRIILVDDYIGVKTLHHLAHSKEGVEITIISDNMSHPRLRLSEYNDFLIENPANEITFKHSLRRVHDRYIIIDRGMKNMAMYHCGASSKDAGKRITTITKISDADEYAETVSELLSNPKLTLD